MGEWGKLCPHPEHELHNLRGESYRQVGEPFRVTWYSFLNIPAGGLGLGTRSSGLPARSVTLTAGDRRAGKGLVLGSDWVRLFSAPVHLHLGLPTCLHHRDPCNQGAGVWEGAAAWTGSRQTLESDCVRNLRDRAPSHGATDNRPLARERQALSRPSLHRPQIQSEKGGAERLQHSGRAHWLCVLRRTDFSPTCT